MKKKLLKSESTVTTQKVCVADSIHKKYDKSINNAKSRTLKTEPAL